MPYVGKVHLRCTTWNQLAYLAISIGSTARSERYVTVYLLRMTTPGPRRLVPIKGLACRPPSVDILRYVATATFAQDVSIVRWWANRNRPCRSSEKITKPMSKSLELIGLEFELIVDDNVMCRLCLSMVINLLHN